MLQMYCVICVGFVLQIINFVTFICIADPSSKYRSVDGYPDRCFMNYTSQVSLALPMVIESEAKAQKIRYSTRKNPHRLKAFNA